MRKGIENEAKSKIMASKFLNKILKNVEISEKEDEKDINSKIITKNVYICFKIIINYQY